MLPCTVSAHVSVPQTNHMGVKADLCVWDIVKARENCDAGKPSSADVLIHRLRQHLGHIQALDFRYASYPFICPSPVSTLRHDRYSYCFCLFLSRFYYMVSQRLIDGVGNVLYTHIISYHDPGSISLELRSYAIIPIPQL